MFHNIEAWAQQNTINAAYLISAICNILKLSRCLLPYYWVQFNCKKGL
jgi:hypothetical protein